MTGTYAQGATTADLEVFEGAQDPITPEWWNQRALIGVPTGAHDVWLVEGGPDVTATCFLDNQRLWELAGPRLPASP